MPPAASGPRSTKATKKSIRHNIVSKKNIIEIKNRDNLCCAQAIVTGKAWVERNTSNKALHDYENIRRDYPIQQRKAGQNCVKSPHKNSGRSRSYSIDEIFCLLQSQKMSSLPQNHHWQNKTQLWKRQMSFVRQNKRFTHPQMLSSNR